MSLLTNATKLLESMDDPLERDRYKNIQKEIETDPHIEWGKDINVLIISDRCGGRAFGLYSYLIDSHRSFGSHT